MILGIRQKKIFERDKFSINCIKSGYCSSHASHFSSTVQFWRGFFFFFFLSFEQYLQSQRHCSYRSFFFGLGFFFFFFFFLLYILLYFPNKFHNIFIITKVLISFINQNKIIKYEIVTNHN